jgi:hypothetical protein
MLFLYIAGDAAAAAAARCPASNNTVSARRRCALKLVLLGERQTRITSPDL